MIPEPAGIWMPPLPPPPGSGKFGTPCDRMQSANRIPDARTAAFDLPLEFAEEPHAVRAAEEATAASAATSLRLVFLLLVRSTPRIPQV